MLKSSACIYESSCSQFFRTTTEIQSVRDAFDKSRLVMTFLTNLEVTEISCSFRLVLEGKTGKEIPGSLKLEPLENFLANTFALSGSEDISGLLNRGGMADLPLFKTILAICQKSQELEFLQKFLANIFALSDAEDNTSGLLNREMEDLPLLKTLLAICKKS